MANRIHIEKIRDELSKLTNIESLMKEADRLTKELRKIDLNRLTEPAHSKIRQIEKRYDELVKMVHRVQTQIDREVKALSKTFQKSRKDVNSSLMRVKKAATKQKKKIQKAIKKKVKKKITKKKKKTTKKVAKKTTKKTTKKKATKKATKKASK